MFGGRILENYLMKQSLLLLWRRSLGIIRGCVIDVMKVFGRLRSLPESVINVLSISSKVRLVLKTSLFFILRNKKGIIKKLVEYVC